MLVCSAYLMGDLGLFALVDCEYTFGSTGDFKGLGEQKTRPGTVLNSTDQKSY